MTTAFEEAKRELNIDSVFLRRSHVFMDDEIDPKTLLDHEPQTQSFRVAEKVKEVELVSENSDRWEYHIFYSIGLRLVEKDNEENVLFEITAVFNAKYLANKKLDLEVIEAFSDENVGYHVWPYWREFVQSTCARLNIPSLSIPFYLCQSSKSDS